MKTLPRLTLILCAAGLQAAQAYTVSILPGQRSLFLQVGTGTMNGGSFRLGGTPGSNSTVNTASVMVQSAEFGMSYPQTMISDSTATVSSYEGSTMCDRPSDTGKVYVGGFTRLPSKDVAAAVAATLTVTTPSRLTNANGDTLPFSSIDWISSGEIVSDASPTIPNGTFTGGTQTLIPSIKRNTWFENCLTFRYRNTQLVVSGTFTGQATFTLIAP